MDGVFSLPYRRPRVDIVEMFGAVMNKFFSFRSLESVCLTHNSVIFGFNPKTTASFLQAAAAASAGFCCLMYIFFPVLVQRDFF